jgi:drug/metabolite transporter (DMT)-like permease
MSRLEADIALLLAAAVWGVSFLFQKSAMAHLGPLVFVAARSAVAALALAPLALREGRRIATAPAPFDFWLVAAGGGLAFLVAAWLQQAGLRTSTVANAGFLTALYVVLTPFVVWGWSGRIPGPIVWPAVTLSALGTWLLGGGRFEAFSAGDLLVALSALFWAVHVVVTGNASRHRRPLAFTAIPFAVRSGARRLPRRAPRDRHARGPPGRRHRHRLRRPPVERAHLHRSDGRAAVHAARGGRCDREPGNRFRRARRLPGAGRAARPIGWAGAALILAATLLLQIGAALGSRWRSADRP